MKPSRNTLALAACLLLPACTQPPATPQDASNGTEFPAISVPPPTEAEMARSLDPAMQPEREPDVIYLPTPEAVMDAMLELAGVGPDDVLYDLGSGDGRIPVAAAKRFGIRAVGIEIDPALVQEARANAEAAGVADKVDFLQQDMFQADIGEASVVTLYLLQSLNIRLRPKLVNELRPGTRIVSHTFDMGDVWEPERIVTVEHRQIYLWTVPER